MLSDTVYNMANLSLELLTTGQSFSPIQVKDENMTHLVTGYQYGLPQRRFATGRFTTVLDGSPQLWTVHHSIVEDGSPQVKNYSSQLDKIEQ